MSYSDSHKESKVAQSTREKFNRRGRIRSKEEKRKKSEKKSMTARQ